METKKRLLDLNCLLWDNVELFLGNGVKMNLKKALIIAGALVGGLILYWLIKKVIALIVLGVAVIVAYFFIKNVFFRKEKEENTGS